jgi:hypothetical protein
MKWQRIGLLCQLHRLRTSTMGIRVMPGVYIKLENPCKSAPIELTDSNSAISLSLQIEAVIGDQDIDT